MSRAIDAEAGAGRREFTRQVDAGCQLSPLQQGMLFHWLLDRHSGRDIEQVVGHLDEEIDPVRFAAAWQEAVNHFSVLRTAFAWEGQAEPRQYVRAQATLEFCYRDAAGERQVEDFLSRDRREGVDLTSAPAMRVTLLRMGEDQFVMVWTFHHILLDGRAFEIILKDVFATYAGSAVHAHADRPYREFAEWSLRQDTQASRAFWRERLAGYTTLVPLPAPPDTANEVAGLQRAERMLSVNSSQRLRDRAIAEGLSLNILILGAWALVLSLESGMRDVVIGATKTTRRGSIPDADRMVGMFLATIPVRVDVDLSLTAADWLRRVRDDWVAMRGHEHLPLVDIRAESELPAQGALFETLVMFDTSQLEATLRAQGGEWLHRRFTTYEQTGFPVTLLAYDGEQVMLRLETDTRRMDAAAAERWHSRLAGILESWSEDVSRPLSAALDDQMLPDVTASVLHSRDVSPETQQRAGTVHGQIQEQVRRTPDAKAVTSGDETISYRELDRRANQVAAQLRRRGAGPGTLVGICVNRSIEMVVGLIGILKAGSAYVPLDPAYPTDRLTLMLDDANVHTVVTQRALSGRFSEREEPVLLLDDVTAESAWDEDSAPSCATPEDLAYVIFTSGSTGRPKGTMIEHRNVTNFFRGMDEVLGSVPGVWLATTSISFDISVLELFWTLARGFHVVVAPAFDRGSIEQRDAPPASPRRAMDFGLFYFAAHAERGATGDAYRLLLDGARFADTHGFSAVWTPERHFHPFGGLYPNPAVTTAALSTITSRVHLRAGSIVLPLHNPLRVAEEWAVIDQLSGGRVGLSFASGWHANDFALMPENFAQRREVMAESIDTVLKLWRGESVSVPNGAGDPVDLTIYPRPVQARPPIWLASAGSVDTFVLAGRLGANVLTNMLGQDIQELTKKFAAYRDARREHGHEGEGNITVMLHTYVTDDSEDARRVVRRPFTDYLAASFDLVKVAPAMFPAFRQPSRAGKGDQANDPLTYTDEDMAALLDHAFDRYFDTAGLFGTPERAIAMIDRLAEAGATEVACLIDFGVDAGLVLENLPHLDRLRRMCADRGAPAMSSTVDATGGLARLIRDRGITHLQCTPSMARVLADDPDVIRALAGLDTILLGGEALPADLAHRLASTVRGRILNMYGPTETTVWSTTAVVHRDLPPTIGRPIANTSVYVLDENLQPVARGAHGELFIGGKGVVRGYLRRPELTGERFLPDPFRSGGRMYRTGDIASMRPDGELEYRGRADDQIKVSGYRVEPGEIEATLARHAAVQQSVVLARSTGHEKSGSCSPRLVAYVVPSFPAAVNGKTEEERVSQWQRLWDETYENAQIGNEASDPRFDIAGWNDSFSGQPMPAKEMEEWLDNTVARILALSPRRMLEVGCGTGLLLYRILPSVEHYTAVDIAAPALAGIRRELRDDEAARVMLLQQPADKLERVAEGSVDVVVINSVTQYFPSASYLVRVLRRAASVVTDGGSIFVGDVRSLEQLEAFHTAYVIHEAHDDLDATTLRARIGHRIAQEGELVLSAEFFEALRTEIPRITGVEVQLKRGTARNELTSFRYDVTLRIGGRALPASNEGTERVTAGQLREVERMLASAPDHLHLVDLPNARLAGIWAARREIRACDDVSVGFLRDLMRDAAPGIDPDALFAFSDEYDVQLRWAASGDPSRFDADLRRRNGMLVERVDSGATTYREMRAEYANAPAARTNEADLSSQLRAHLRRTLPDHMIPATFVFVRAMPLTPNGKIDRKALPSPEELTTRVSSECVPPAGELERQIADVWRDLLATDAIGRQDNFFELGANSLLTMQANTRLSALLHRPIALVSMFQFPTVASLAAHLVEQVTSNASQSAERRSHDRASRAEHAAERRRALRAEQGVQ